MNIEKYLPIGTVVILKNATKRVMITGFAVKGKETGDTIYDYMGCLYPEGVISTDKNIVFNHEQIEKVFFVGYKDEEWTSIEQKLKEIVQNNTQTPVTNTQNIQPQQIVQEQPNNQVQLQVADNDNQSTNPNPISLL